MKISTKGRYALRLMLDLALNQQDLYVSLKDIAERQDISKKYLEQIVTALNKADFLMTNRGFQGGYRLARQPKDYTVGEILRITEGNLSVVSCLVSEPNTCDRNTSCMTLPVWEGLNKVISDYLYGISLQDIIDNNMDSGAYNFSI